MAVVAPGIVDASSGVGLKIVVGTLGLVLLGLEWIAVVLTQPRKDEMEDYDYDNWFVNMLESWEIFVPKKYGRNSVLN